MQPLKQQAMSERYAFEPLPAGLTYAAIVDVRNVETEITDFMVRRACEEMDSQQQYPFCGRAPKKRHNT